MSRQPATRKQGTDSAAAASWTQLGVRWLRDTRSGMFALATVVGLGSGLGAVVFRYLIYAFTWLATGHKVFGQQGRVASAHLPWLGVGFFVLIPVIGGLLYGPMIYRFAREARGHGVPEVMIAVAENGGRIRPQVSVVKSVASALCIGVGGSVGREGPIVQIGSALASSFGQLVRMPESRLRILVACGAGGGIAATFNAPITGVFFGVEIILREFSIDALFSVILSAMLADVVAIPFLGNRPFLHGFPPGIVLHNPRNYLLIAVLAVFAALLGVAFSKIVYKVEDLWDILWKGRPEWARPAVGGIALGLVLLAVPEMYGVGYPVMFKTVAGGYALWFLFVLVAAKLAATSLSLGIGGSGGIFAPSLFLGVTSGMAYGEIVHHIFGPGAGQPALYAVVAMGAVFTSAARAPLTSVASVVEMTGDFTLTLPVMLAVGIASSISRVLTYGTIYTTKLLRRGNDIDRAAPWRAFADMKVADAMHTFDTPVASGDGAGAADGAARGAGNGAGTVAVRDWAALVGPVSRQREPHAVFTDESLGIALRQLQTYGREGLPVLSADGRYIQGWIAAGDVIRAVAGEIGIPAEESAQAEAHVEAAAEDWAGGGQPARHEPPAALRGYRLVEVTTADGSKAAGRELGSIEWPHGSIAVAVVHEGELREPGSDVAIAPGDRVVLLTPAAAGPDDGRPARAGGGAARSAEDPPAGARPEAPGRDAPDDRDGRRSVGAEPGGRDKRRET